MQVGGQAVIEGVMMRAKGMIATAVRRPDGKIVVKKEEFHSLAERYPILRIPVIRGAVGLIEMMYIGIKTLNYSAEIALDDSSGDETAPKKSQSTFSLSVTLVVALALGIGIFFFIPLFIATLFFRVEQQPLLFNLVAGAIRITILIAYLYSISLMKDVIVSFSITVRSTRRCSHSSKTRRSKFFPRCNSRAFIRDAAQALFYSSCLCRFFSSASSIRPCC